MRTILHVDANSFYASCECLYRPSIREKPVAVCGDPEARHGIVLTKNQYAKKYGVQTGEAIWQAKQKCVMGRWLALLLSVTCYPKLKGRIIRPLGMKFYNLLREFRHFLVPVHYLFLLSHQ